MTNKRQANQEIETAYIAGQNDGYANKVFRNPFDPAKQDDLWCAFAAGYEDGRDQYANECALDPRDDEDGHDYQEILKMELHMNNSGSR